MIDEKLQQIRQFCINTVFEHPSYAIKIYDLDGVIEEASKLEAYILFGYKPKDTDSSTRTA